MQRTYRLGMSITGLVCGIGLSAVSWAASAGAEALPPTRDPLGKFNRAMFQFNKQVDHYFLKPVAKMYQTLLPKVVTIGIHNTVTNLMSGTVILNDVLQANFYQATADSFRFLINSTLGLGGLIDVGSRVGLPSHPQGFGLTLTNWGYRDSTYVVLPFWGPSTLRDTISLPFDYFTTPYPYTADAQVRTAVEAVQVIDTRSTYLHLGRVMNEMALDPYVLQREAYLQHQAYSAEHSRDRWVIPPPSRVGGKS